MSFQVKKKERFILSQNRIKELMLGHKRSKHENKNETDEREKKNTKVIVIFIEWNSSISIRSGEASGCNRTNKRKTQKNNIYVC